jgi:hypothetical protein
MGDQTEIVILSCPDASVTFPVEITKETQQTWKH